MPISIHEADPNFPPNQRSYSPYQHFPSSGSQQGESSTQSSKRQLPQEPGYANGVKTSKQDNLRISPQDASTSPISYPSHINLSFSTLATNTTFDNTHISPVSPATTPTAIAYSDEFEARQQMDQHVYNPYDKDVDLNYLQPGQSSSSLVSGEPAPPLPPKISYMSNSSLNNRYDDSIQLPPRECLCHLYEMG